ncbi:MAG: hypothetical protein QGG23_07710 [Candidatus Bathyarchaeota archaeon]|nr:hypothetical protein [Candidatus Bathyarchaeota archaeon]MDP7443751.1 hypothetical protein [Candidatus Bathyarchaeota archaeon]
MKVESVARKRKGKREYLNDVETGRMMGKLDEFFRSKVDIPLIRHGKRHRIETLINEESILSSPLSDTWPARVLRSPCESHTCLRIVLVPWFWRITFNGLYIISSCLRWLVGVYQRILRGYEDEVKRSSMSSRTSYRE